MALDASHHHDAARRSDSQGDRTGGRQPAQAGTDLDQALALARAGDEHGFAVLWRTLHPPLAAVPDRAWQRRSLRTSPPRRGCRWCATSTGFQGDAQAFRGWLFTVARHRAVDQGRARATRPVVTVAEPHADRAEGSTPSAEHDAVEREATAAALRLVATLPPEQAEMVMLRVVAGLDVAVVAELVGKKPGAVRVAVHRALKSLSRDPQVRTAARGGV